MTKAINHFAFITSLARVTPALSIRQLAVLMTLHFGEGRRTVKDLSGDLNMVKPAVSRALASLEGFGFVKRYPSGDGRSPVFHATAKGITHLNKGASNPS